MDWREKAPIAITVCDKNGKIIEMNLKAKQVFRKFRENLLGKKIFDCHNEHSKKKLRLMFKNKNINVYTIEKNKLKKLIYQFPWYDKKKFAGYVELSIELPLDIPHFIRN